MPLSSLQKKRYSRHLAMSSVGAQGQEILLNSKVLIVGAGGLGSPLAYYLAAAGIGHIGIIDSDNVELSNLNRQILYTTDNIDRPKTECAYERLQAINPDITITPYYTRLTEENIDAILSGFDIIADASDNFATRFLINKFCIHNNKILVWAAAQEFKGQVSVVKTGYACFQCFCPVAPADINAPQCTDNGIIGSITGVIASLQVTEIVKELLHIGNSLAGKLLIYDGLDARFRQVQLAVHESCEVCKAS
jgi:molybdopterin/thiamine biosynthesis adenylyltransferase